MNESILVSVIVPVYQVEQYVGRCIESLLAQTYSELEILLVDDGSRDRSGEICDEYAQKDSRITVYHKKNGGLSDARNYGIDRAKGEYISFVDSDDFVTSDFVEYLLKNCLENKCDLSVCDFKRVTGDELTETGENQIKVKTGLDCLEAVCGNTGEHVLMTVAWNKLYKREFFETIRYPVGQLHEDEATTYKILYQAERVVISTRKMYAYFMSQDSIMRREYSDKRLVIVEILLERMKFFRENGLEHLEAMVKNQMSDTIIYHYYNVRKYISDSKNIQRKLVKCLKNIA